MNYTIRIASYKNSKSIFAKFIRFQQKVQGFDPRFSKLSHSEIVFCYTDDKQVEKRLMDIKYIKNNGCRKEQFENKNLWFSSSEQDDGTRFAFIEDNKNHWEYHNIEITKKQYLELLDYYISIDNLPYAWKSIFFTQGIKTLWFKTYKTLFCSESVLLGLQLVLGLMPGIDAVTCNPALLAYGLEKKIKLFTKEDLKYDN